MPTAASLGNSKFCGWSTPVAARVAYARLMRAVTNSPKERKCPQNMGAWGSRIGWLRGRVQRSSYLSDCHRHHVWGRWRRRCGLGPASSHPGSCANWVAWTADTCIVECKGRRLNVASCTVTCCLHHTMAVPMIPVGKYRGRQWRQLKQPLGAQLRVSPSFSRIWGQQRMARL